MSISQIKRFICAQTLFTCTQIIANLGNLLNPFLPRACKKIQEFIDLDEPNWETVVVPVGRMIRNASHLFERIPPERIQKEEQRLVSQLDR